MNQAKRHLDESEGFDEKIKILRKLTFDKNNTSVTCIEQLSNEIFYEIFDYLDGCDIFDAFSNLNTRFNDLVNHSSLLIKIYRSNSSNEISSYQYQQFIIPNSHRIISFYIHNRYIASFFPLHMIVPLFNRLESIEFRHFELNNLISILSNLTTLPRLYSLKITFNKVWIDIDRLYKSIFCLPVLKYNNISEDICHITSYTSMSNFDAFSSIEHLVIGHTCDIDQLINILSYTPRLIHLTCNNLQSRRPIEEKIPFDILNLRYVCIKTCYIHFNELEILMKKLFLQVQVLRFVTYRDNSYLDADHWNQLILNYMPYLRVLDFKYVEHVYDEFTLKPYIFKLNQFISPFWIERKWFFELKIELDSPFPTLEVTYAIQPFKKQWYELHNDVNSNETTTCSSLSQQEYINISYSHLDIIIKNAFFLKNNLLLPDYISSIIVLIQFTSLRINLQCFSISTLIQLLRLLPNLDSLTVTSEFPDERKILSEKQINMIHFVSINNKITKVNLEKMTELDQVHIIMNLCPHMRNFQVKCRNNLDVEWLIQYVLKKRNTNFTPNLCSLCLQICEANDDMVQKLKIIINTEKLVYNYTIKRICDKIYLRWYE